MARERPVRPRLAKLRSFTADTSVNGHDYIVLMMRSGRYERQFDKKTGEMVDEVRDPQRQLRANIGDKLIVMGPDVEHTAMVIVDRIELVGYHDRLSTRRVVGLLPPGAGLVHVLPARAPKGRRS